MASSMLPSTVDNIVVVDDIMKMTKICIRECRTPDRKRVIGAWALYQDVNDLIPANKGWQPPETPFPPPFEIVPLESKGRGLVATRRIQKGEVIIRERPIIMIPKMFWTNRRYQKLPEDSIMLQLLYLLEQRDRERFLQLHNCMSLDEYVPPSGILRTNALAALFPESKECPGYSVICLNISYANHSCDPNATHRFDRKTITKALLATRNIERGEEITTAYIDTSSPKSDRQEQLKRRYRFTCNCTLCSTQM
ncbi:hypothetical protein ACEPAG_9165 [Sanghuangporus baumii]